MKYDKYLKRKNAAIPQHNLEIWKKGDDLAFEQVLPIGKKNVLLSAGYLESENGFYHSRDGSVYAAVLTKMPKVNVEMIDWWFWWHAKEGIRYRIWYPEMHFDISSDFGGYYNDESKSYRERLWLSTHYVAEDIGTGRKKIAIKFMSPEQFGFDKELLRSESEQTIICAKVGSLSKGAWHTKMCHLVRKVDQGVEMRSRFWIGNDVKRMGGFAQNFINGILNRPFVQRILIPKNVGQHMFHHCSQEYNNLADLLPELFREENLEKSVET